MAFFRHRSRRVAGALVALAATGLALAPGGAKPATKSCTRQLQSGVLALGLCAVQALVPTTAGAISADDYLSLYGSSASSNEKKKFEVPDLPKPKFEAPKIEAPKFDAPKFEAPKFEAPKFEAPKFDAPKFDAPKFDAPKFDAPKFDAPKVDLPKVDVPSISLPSAPSLPSFSFGGSSEPAETPAAPVEPDEAEREAIDEQARATAKEFRRADAIAKQKESEARALRKTANEKKKIAKVAKDAACEYRPGGKLLCIRGFKSGF